MRVRVLEGFNKQFFLLLFDVALEYLSNKYSNGSAMKNIPPFSVLKKQNIPVPPEEEQAKIVEFLSQKCAKLNAIITRKCYQVEHMKAYKASLVYEYATGKKRVKGVE